MPTNNLVNVTVFCFSVITKPSHRITNKLQTRQSCQRIPGGVEPPILATACMSKNSLFLLLFLVKIPGFFCRGDKKILTTEMDVINSMQHDHIIFFFQNLLKKKPGTKNCFAPHADTRCNPSLLMYHTISDIIYTLK